MALSPAACVTLVKKGMNVQVEEGAGMMADFKNEDYEKAGAKIVSKYCFSLPYLHYY